MPIPDSNRKSSSTADGHAGEGRKGIRKRRRGNTVKPIDDPVKSEAASSAENAETDRKFLFNADALHAGLSGDHLFEEPPEEDFNEVVDWDDERVEHFVRKELIGVMLESLPFRVLILGIIIVNSFLIALQTDESYSIKWAYEFSIFDKVVLVIFVCEILLKWYYDFWVFWKSNSNILDLFIIVALFLGPNAMMGNEKMLKILRVLRAFRSLRSISAFAGLQMVIKTIVQSLPDMANIGLLLVIILTVLAVVGVFLFATELPQHFGDLGRALFSLFICVTQDGWMNIFEDFQRKGGAMYYGGMFYFSIAIMVGSFVFANLIVAIVVTNLEWSINQMKEEQKRKQDILLKSAESDAKHDFADTNIPILTINSLMAKEKFNLKQQTPLELPDFSTLNKDKLENYFMILIALEENMKEYNLIREDMEKIFGVVQDFNLVEEDDNLVSSSTLAAELVNSLEVDLIKITWVSPDHNVNKGDILSNLIKLEGANFLSTKKANNLGQALKQGMIGSQMNIARTRKKRPSQQYERRGSQQQ